MRNYIASFYFQKLGQVKGDNVANTGKSNMAPIFQKLWATACKW